MKNTALTAIAITVLGLSACKKDKAAGDPPAPTAPVAKDDPAKPATPDPTAKPVTPDPAPAPAPTPAADTTFTSTDGGYSADFGDKPTEQVSSQPTALGTLDIHVAARDMGTGALMISWQEQPKGAATNPKEVLDGQRDGMMKSFPGAKLTDQKDITLDGHPGRSFKIRMVSPDATQFTRVYFVGNKLYQTAAISIGEGDEQTATKFLDSFKLTAAK